jgi:hypothetical protein
MLLSRGYSTTPPSRLRLSDRVRRSSDREPPRPGDLAVGRNEPAAGRDLARSWRRGAQSLRLVNRGSTLMGTSAIRSTRRVTLAAVLIAASSWPNPTGSQAARAASPAPTRAQQAGTMKIRIHVDGARLTATLDDTAASRDFVSLLPLTLTLDDYNGTEKISDLPKKLSTKDAPAGIDPSVDDITYYSPWGNLAIFYKDFAYSRGLVKLGRIDSGIEAFDRPGTRSVIIQRIDE